MSSGQEKIAALVIGAGPAGLMAAETLAAQGHAVLVADAMPSIGRKFLMAGKSGLNLTKNAPPDRFAGAYGPAADWLAPMLADFGPPQVSDWARGLGQEVFMGTTGRVFPVTMKASPLLRAWAGRLAGLGVGMRTRWRWQGWDGAESLFATPGGPARILADTAVLALGGASWSRLGSDGAWAGPLASAGVTLAPFAPANAGLRVAWSGHMARHFGSPVKGVALSVGVRRSRGEFVVSARGLEGGGIYALGPALRGDAHLRLDLVPDIDLAKATARLSGRGKSSLTTHLRRALRLSPVQIALAMEWGRPLPVEPAALAARLKALSVRHDGFRPLDEAISTAGGVTRAALTDDLMLHARPGTFVAGEMLDWEAPTGGYLLTGCFVTGRHAGCGAARWLARAKPDAEDSRA